MYQYLYAIADRLPAAWRPPDASVGGPVELRRLGDLVVLVSQLDRLPEANARTLALHHDVVASTLDASATVPFRFGMAVAAADLDGWLAAHAPLVNTTLAQLRGCVEMNVKLLRLHCGHSIDRTCRECADGAPGVVQLRELAERLVTQAGIERWRYLACGVHRLEDSERGRTVRAADEPNKERDGWRGPVGKRQSDPSSLGKHVYLHYGNGRLSARRWIGCACAGGESFVWWSARFVSLVAVTGGVGF